MSAPNPNILPIGPSLTEWAQAMRDVGMEEQAAQYDEDKIANLKRLEDLGLPRYRQRILLASDFAAAPNENLNALDWEKSFVILAPHDISGIRIRQICEKADVLPFVTANIDPAKLGETNVIIQEFLEHHYGGNVMVDDYGGLYVEMVEGTHNQLVSGTKNPEFIARRNPFTRFFQYSFDDPELRLAVFQTVMAMPLRDSAVPQRDFSARDADFMPGYYEFFLTRRSEDGPLEPIFMEYSDKPAFVLKFID